jgi:two-component system, NtrC family, response regulator HydG
MADKRIVIAEDDRATRESWAELLGSWGYKVEVTEDGEQALDAVLAHRPPVVLADLKMARKDGLSLLREIREAGLDVGVVMISGEGDIPDAVSAIKLGAYDYLRKPVDPAHLKALLANIIDHLSVREENDRLRRRLLGEGELGPMLGRSLAMRKVLTLVHQVAPADASAMITGESGTGKELVAKTIHALSKRSQGPYIGVNCAAIPETLMESELFGHERGAFTGADRRRDGYFELADGGTLLLDEISEMRVELQAKLLRVIEERKLRRVGGSTEIPLNVRVLAASNRPLDRAIREGRLREDLYYRLNVFAIELPPLRERPDDIPLLVDAFIREFAGQSGKPIQAADHDCLQALRSNPWPGNVRQLRNVIERAVIVGHPPLLTLSDLPAEIKPAQGDGSVHIRLGARLDDIEREVITRTIDFTGGNKTRAAEVLGVSLKTLYNRLERYERKEAAEAE